MEHPIIIQKAFVILCAINAIIILNAINAIFINDQNSKEGFPISIAIIALASDYYNN